MKRLVLILVLVCSTTGCGVAAIAAIVSEIIAVAGEAQAWISAVERFCDAVFAQHPDPVLQRKVDDALGAARIAAANLDVAARNADHLTIEQLRAVYAAFKAAYLAVMDVTKPLGVKPGELGEKWGAGIEAFVVPPAEHFAIRGLR